MVTESKQQRRAREKAEREARAKTKALTIPEAIEKSLELAIDAEILVGEDSFKAIPAPTISSTLAIQQNRIIDAYVAAAKAKEVFSSARSSLDEEIARLDSVKAAHVTAEAALRNREEEHTRELREIDAREALIDQREKLILEQEAEALSGFRSLLGEERIEWEAARSEADRELQSRMSSIEDGEKSIKKKQRALDLDRELLDEDLESLNQKVERRAASIVAVDRQELAIANDRLKATNQRIEILIRENEQLKSDRWAGGGDINVMASKYRDLQASYDRLLESVANYPSLSEIERLRSQGNELNSLRDQTVVLIREKDALNAKCSKMTQSVGELESLRDQKESAEAQLKIVRDELRKLNVQIEGEENEDGTFPALAKIDRDPEYQSAPTSRTWSLNAGLATFVKELQQSIKGEGFDYSLHDLRCFVAGLAMSRLHVLQGISGTGKTSLPRLFARCINSGARKQGIKIIEVQAGWRDRQDLLGYYNAFEKTYRQTEFLRALYEAQTPRYRDCPYIIVLDEMNLSRPEQYFADLLSALEGDSDDDSQAERNLVLMDRPIDDAPELFVDDRKISIPENVWFVGTANHDETTLEFADKTYDRAHILELPHEPTPVPAGQPPQPSRLSFADLQSAFTKAVITHKADADKAKTYFGDCVEGAVGDEFGIGIGNRLKKRQLPTFVPVFVAAGGTASEAIDHILATRVLRKTVGLHDTNGEQFRLLARRLKEGWTSMSLAGRPERTIALLNKEVRAKEPGNTASVW
jgi:hypothetical protein